MSWSFPIHRCSAQCPSVRITRQSSSGIADGCWMDNPMQSPRVCLAHHCTELLNLAEVLICSSLEGLRWFKMPLSHWADHPTFFQICYGTAWERSCRKVIYRLSGEKTTGKKPFSCYIFIQFSLHWGGKWTKTGDTKPHGNVTDKKTANDGLVRPGRGCQHKGWRQMLASWVGRDRLKISSLTGMGSLGCWTLRSTSNNINS